jgi:hypothetical protein
MLPGLEATDGRERVGISFEFPLSHLKCLPLCRFQHSCSFKARKISTFRSSLFQVFHSSATCPPFTSSIKTEAIID